MSDIRSAETADIDALARVWFDAWRDAHEAIVPAELTRRRTLERFRLRIHDGLGAIRVAGPLGRPVGFCAVKNDELDQLFVSAEARGTGVAAALLADGEARLAASGVHRAFLTCAIGNERAERFYEKHGWSRVGAVIDHLATPEGEIELEVWRYEKTLT